MGRNYSGFVALNVFVVRESMAGGNILLWLHPEVTVNGMFANPIPTAFVAGLLVVALVFFFRSYNEARKYYMKNIWTLWVFNPAVRAGGHVPAFPVSQGNKKRPPFS